MVKCRPPHAGIRNQKCLTLLRMSRSLVTVIAGVLLLSTAARAQLVSTLDPRAIQSAIERALRVAPHGFEALLVPSQTGVQVQSVDISRASSGAERITIDLSQKTLTYDPTGDVEAILD